MSLILVYDVAASTSGALGILQSYHARAIDDRDNGYIFLVSVPELASSKNVRVKRFPWVKKSWLHRLIFDLFIGPKIVRDYSPDSILSLQNTMMPLVKIRQTVYEHNCIPKPFCDISFNFFKDPNLWIRQNILGAMVVRSLKKASHVIVQTKWMARCCSANIGIDEAKITVEPPFINVLPTEKYRRIYPTIFFYPATEMPFKNHRIIVDACRLIRASHPDSVYRVLFTLNGAESRKISRAKHEIEKDSLPIEFLGWKKQDEVYDLYAKSILLFPSLMESFPLPLYEARKVGTPVIAPDLPYAREALSGYVGASFYNAESAEALSEVMLRGMRGDLGPDNHAK
ncbi:glycosyltransferase [Gordonibacter massiliensis (ex Traore et al. 2017)]|uniref:glycosyltransferase n=1 Tax=Gordonibacter massiliensis (ex Traore et al. 2017) TaxID=1841863 RepID=UPI001C8C761A|nr:glycosyltransferase [Gordonibacter massiliensis (ex Traore et al. 2017)]MBX9034607.1 glycosyltransferase family 4 protein [Gordonibacter massiliensis (ex Traore et al. 2017)]